MRNKAAMQMQHFIIITRSQNFGSKDTSLQLGRSIVSCDRWHDHLSYISCLQIHSAQTNIIVYQISVELYAFTKEDTLTVNYNTG